MTAIRSRSESAVQKGAVAWFIATAISQVIFVYYIAMSYGAQLAAGDIEAWSEMTIKGHVDGDGMGNFVFATHLFFAIILILGGLLQLLPWIRKNALTLHKYSSRIYILTALLLSVGGLYLVWIREAILSMNGAVAITLNAILIIVFSILTIRNARSGKIMAHRKWALRTFMVVNGVWFFRVGFMAWILIHQDAKWSTENLDGPFDLVWAYANYLLPLAALELYFYVQEQNNKGLNYLMASILFLSAILIAVGTFGAYLMMWGPSL